MSDMLDRIKAGLADRYPVEREVGRGGMATVYLANDARHQRKVAIKVLSLELVAVLGAERFLREIQLAAKLSHPHILPLHDSGQVEGLLFYVMPYIEGESLRDRLDREGQFPIADAVRIAAKIAAALDYAHRNGVVHRDIKPENILLHEGEPLIADFGIALAVSEAGGDRLTGTGLSIGTPHYMSPEQATGDRKLDARSDIYSLGCVLFEMLAGEPPHTGPTAQAVLARILTETPRELRRLRPSASESLERVLAKSLSRVPADRYPTASAFADALRKTETGEYTSGPTEVHAPVVAETVRSNAPDSRFTLTRSLPWIIAVLALALAASSFLRTGRAPETDQGVEVSTEQLKRILADEQAVVLDTRPHLEYSIGHIPGALNVAARPGVPMSMYESDVAEVTRLVGGNLARPMVLYCNGPLCPKSRRLADELEAVGYTDIRRYQLGIPVWRAFGGVTVIEADGLRHVLSLDRTAVVLDVREAAAFQAGTIAGARHLPRSQVSDRPDVGEIRNAKDDGRLPMTDHNTRIIVVGRTGGDARFVAEAVAREAFHNVAYFPGSFEEAEAALKP